MRLLTCCKKRQSMYFTTSEVVLNTIKIRSIIARHRSAPIGQAASAVGARKEAPVIRDLLVPMMAWI
jgi:hypothetical protein